jgi:uncharacterized protein YigE (DUF2233 family)
MSQVRRALTGVGFTVGIGAILWGALRPHAPGPAEPEPNATEVLARSGPVTAVLDRWTEGSERGWLVATRFPRDAVVEIVPADTAVRFSDLLPTDNEDWAAINGGFYDETGAPMELVVSEGHIHHPLRARGGSGVLEADPLPARIVHRDAWQPGARMALQSIDRLVDAGQPLVASASEHRAARSAVVIGADAVWLVVTFSDTSAFRTDDGFQLQQTSGHGQTLRGFATLLVDHLRAEQALNLDGAVSTQLAARIGGQTIRVLGERGTVQAVVLRTEPSR